MVYSEYGQEIGITYSRQPIRSKARHREPVSCPKIIGITRDVELCVNLVAASDNVVGCLPYQRLDNRNNQDSETGHKIVNYGAPLANTLETLLAKILMVGDAETSTVLTALRMSSGYEADRPTDKGRLRISPKWGVFCLPPSLQSIRTNK